MMTRLPVNARSECVAPSTRPVGGVVESMRMFHAACAASQRPGLSPTRGSGDGAVAETIGSTGFGITAGAGGGGGGGGGVPRPAAGAAAGAGAASGGAAAPVGAGGVGVGDGVAEGVGAAGAAAGAAAGGRGVVAGGDAVLSAVLHANHPTASAATNSACLFFIACDPPASHASARSRCLDPRTHPRRT